MDGFRRKGRGEGGGGRRQGPGTQEAIQGHPCFIRLDTPGTNVKTLWNPFYYVGISILLENQIRHYYSIYK